MNARIGDFLPSDRQLFPRDIASAVVKVLDERKLTAKQASRRYAIDEATAANIRRGVCSLGTFLKIALTEGRDFWTRIGDDVYGETLDEYEERRLQQIISEADDAREKLVRIRARREALDACASDALDAWARAPAQQNRDRHG